MRVLVTGGFGVFGSALARVWPHVEVELVRAGHDSLDVRHAASVHSVLAAIAPDVVLHAAALTDHGCRDAAALIATNVVGTTHVARAARAFGARLVYLSTHYVYGGEAPEGGYDEWSEPAPIGAYAWSKLAGEHAALEASADALIVRGSWYDFKSRIASWMQLGVVCDAWATRQPVADAARDVTALVLGGARGVFNIGGPRRTFTEVVYDECGDRAATMQFTTITRAALTVARGLDYPFPRDTSVSTRKFASWGRDRLGVGA